MPPNTPSCPEIRGSGSVLDGLERVSRRILGWPARRVVFVTALMAAAFICRAVLVSRGGQHFFYDEAKFSTATDAAALMANGHVREALVYTIEPHRDVYADHVGFKMLGIIPELDEARYGRNDRVPAYFFSVFSALNVLLLALVALRLTGSAAAFDAALLAAAASAVLIIYTRFIIPYDVSLFFALLALWVGVKRPGGALRSGAVGALCCWSFLCYFGHWQLAGLIGALHVLWMTDGVRAFLKHAVSTALGFAAVFGAIVLLSRFGTDTFIHDIMEVTKAQGVGADFRSSVNTWLYFFYAERFGLILWLAVFLSAIVAECRAPRPPGGRLLTPLRLMALGFFVLYAVFVVDSDIRHHLVVHGRHSRQLAPFMIIGFGIGLDYLCARRRFGNLAYLGALAALAVNGALILREPFMMVFPKDFDAKAEAILASRPKPADGRSYYRKVNVDNFTFEPEVLRDPPLETLLAARHPLQYLPYIYEGESPELKRARRSVDHRLRLVRMAVRPAETVGGGDYGIVSMNVVFPSNRAGFAEPLLSIGPRHNGELFFVRYDSAATLRLGFISMGNELDMSGPIEVRPGTSHTLRLYSGSLMAPDRGNSDGATQYLEQSVLAEFDGKTLIRQPVARHSALPGEVYAGVNVVEVSQAGAQFSGSITDVTRGGLPPVPSWVSKSGTYGGVHLKVMPPPVSNGTAEPLLVVGVRGRAVLGYMRIYPDGTLVFGAEVWGIGIFESKRLPAPAATPLEVDYTFGSLLPPVGSAAWRGASLKERSLERGSIRILVGGEPVLDAAQPTPDFDRAAIYYGENPVGGSTVNAGFSGRVVAHYRRPLGK